MNSEKAREILRKAQQDDSIVCLYFSAYSERFAAGFVEAVSEKHVVLRNVSTHGRYSGWFMRELNDLCRIDYGGRYEETLLSLYRAREQNHPPFLLETHDDTDLMNEVLMAAQTDDFGVSIDTGSDERNWGFVKEIELSTMTIERFDLHGQRDSDATFDLEHIEKVMVDSEDLQDLKLLTRWNELPPSTK